MAVILVMTCITISVFAKNGQMWTSVSTKANLIVWDGLTDVPYNLFCHSLRYFVLVLL